MRAHIIGSSIRSAACRFAMAMYIAALPVVAAAQWWNPQSPIAPGKWAMLGHTFKYTDATYAQAVQVIGEAVKAGDYAKLDRMHDEFLALLQKGGNGERMLASFTEAFQWQFSGERLDHDNAFFDEWHKRVPDSKLRAAAEASMWWAVAWQARGSGYGKDVSPEAWKIFNERLDHALHALADGGPKAQESPVWYWMAISVAGSRGDPDPMVDAICDEGAGRFPHFVPIYDARVNFLLPQWGGDYAKVDAFIRRAVMRTQALEGTSLYAMLYARVHRTYHGDDFFRDTKASWRLMRHGYEDEVAQGRANLNEYATFACIARDRDTTRELLTELGDNANLGAGMQGFSTEACQELVKEAK